MDEVIEVNETKKFKNLKIFKAALGVLSCATALISGPIMTGITFAAGLGGVIAEAVLDNAEPAMSR